MCLDVVVYVYFLFFCFFFRGVDGIRDSPVTGVQSCALLFLGGFLVGGVFGWRGCWVGGLLGGGAVGWRGCWVEGLLGRGSVGWRGCGVVGEKSRGGAKMRDSCAAIERNYRCLPYYLWSTHMYY